MFPHLHAIRRLIALAALCLTLMPVAQASPSDNAQWTDDNLNYDLARRAVREGKALPMSEILEHLRRHFKGDVVATKYEYEYERWVYDFKIIGPQGNVEHIHLDALTGDVVDISDR